MFDLKAFLATVPNLPGVYRMISAEGVVIYVGKARDLKRRVSSYFQKQHGSPRTAMMVSQVVRVEITITRSEGEALLLEGNLIKSLSPRYNVLFKDDKSYPYIMITGQQYPQIRFYRGVFDPRHQYFGPYPNAWAVRETIGQLQKVFRLRTCEDNVFRNRSRPCLLYQIHRCSGSCVGSITAEAYAEDVRHARLFLEGKETEVIEELTRRMQAASDALDFEAAAYCRDEIGSLRRILAKQFVESSGGRDADVIAVHADGAMPCVNLVMVRGGRHLGDKSFFPSNADGADLSAIGEAFIIQHYSDKRIPPLIVCSVLEDGEAVAAVLSERAERVVQVVTQPIGERRTWLDMALKNARLALAQKAAQDNAQGVRLTAMQEVLGLPPGPTRMECFDISHTMGELTVASCVVFEEGEAVKGDYRRYNITGITPGDDYAAMRDVLNRRYQKIAAGEGKMPDLVFIDGGRGQLNAAIAVMQELGLGDLPLVGIAKGEERKPGLEELVFPGREEGLHLPADHPGLHLIQQIRDEAHRFAITGHRARREKARTKSSLEEIAGVGAKRRQRLLNRFGGLRGVLSASVDDLATVEGIGRELAEKIYRELH
ncbi:MAG: excinuclease ABC subunit UvrC [Pseudomonadota bacterium]|nr:excinuclease ABC subunit UvrC [Pseudomonadota bacterium]